MNQKTYSIYINVSSETKTSIKISREWKKKTNREAKKANRQENKKSTRTKAGDFFSAISKIENKIIECCAWPVLDRIRVLKNHCMQPNEIIIISNRYVKNNPCEQIRANEINTRKQKKGRIYSSGFVESDVMATERKKITYICQIFSFHFFFQNILFVFFFFLFTWAFFLRFSFLL